MTNMKTDKAELARRIAQRLFTNGFDDFGTRLEIKQQPTGAHYTAPEKSLGGWCFNAAVDQIVSVLNEAKPD